MRPGLVSPQLSFLIDSQLESITAFKMPQKSPFARTSVLRSSSANGIFAVRIARSQAELMLSGQIDWLPVSFIYPTRRQPRMDRDRQGSFSVVLVFLKTKCLRSTL